MCCRFGSLVRRRIIFNGEHYVNRHKSCHIQNVNLYTQQRNIAHSRPTNIQKKKRCSMLLKGFFFNGNACVKYRVLFGSPSGYHFLLPYFFQMVAAHPLAVNGTVKANGRSNVRLNVCFCFKLYLFFVLFISVDVFLAYFDDF